MYLVKTPSIIQKLFPSFHWRVSGEQQTIYLTFDDGPIPQVTPWVLDQLAEHEAQATFFCVGENAERHPDLIKRIQQEGHQLGNHTMKHLDGWATENLPYYHDIRHCSELVQSRLFRPPYGRIRPRQTQFLQRHYEIVMWDVLSGDFDPHLSPEACLNNVVKNAKAGSIVVFHDSLKAKDKLEVVLPQVLSYFRDQGYAFSAIKPELLTKERQLNPRPQLRTA